MEKTKQLYVLPALVKCHSTAASFDMWMSKAGHDIFALVIKLETISSQSTLPLVFLKQQTLPDRLWLKS
jgi:hypothetical protein